jgi:hypothetical protein
MISFEKLRHRCRNPRCRSNLKVPVDSQREAFCTKGCFNSFYRRRCIVCEREFERKSEPQRCCERRKCRAEFRRDKGHYLGRWGDVSGAVISPPKTPAKMGIKSRSGDGRPPGGPMFWRDGDGRGWWWEADQDVEHRLFNRAGELVARLSHRGGCWLLTWPRTTPEQSAGDLEAAKRLAITIALASLPDPTATRHHITLPESDPGDFLEHEWQEVISSDGVVCEVRGRALDTDTDLLDPIEDAPALTPGIAVDGDGFEIPEFLRRVTPILLKVLVPAL